jgi:DNA repair protein RecN (Recombination protein N)
VQVEQELAAGDDSTGTLERARQRVAVARGALSAAGRALSAGRTAAAAEWGERVSRELKPLGLPRARIEFVVGTAREADERPVAHGQDEVAIRFTANPGESPRPLQRIASGGELSRVMLALKSVLQEQDRVALLLFDEVDSGIGGAVAQAVGERLRRLSRHRQVICVTHLPMIAALAAHHLRVTKHVSGGRTVARIDAVEGDARVAELARMLAGDRVTDTTRRQARELLGAVPARAGGR